MKIAEMILKGDREAIAEVRAGLEPYRLSRNDITRIWEATIIRILAGGDKETRRELIRLGTALDDMSHPHADMYADLFTIAAFPHLKEAFEPTIRVGAHVVRTKDGENGMADHGQVRIFLEMAKQCLVGVLRKGTDESKEYAASALRHFTFEDDVKDALLHVVGNGESQRVKRAAGESLGHMRVEREDANATANRLLLLLQHEKDSPQAQYINYIYDAIVKVMGDADSMERRIAAKQLATFGLRPGPVSAVLDRGSLETIQESVENALLHALGGEDIETREEAARGLSAIGDERVEGILRKIAGRETKSNGAGSAALRVLKAIQKKKLGYELPPPLPLRPLKESNGLKARIRA